ncbi:hypothetical protein SAICODRAFT_26363 [Saitoella complicata NRRL Y-17804]|uniref:Uncharacterized protein n=1 Tax=Saitoella complicata (strain BCRC 22490 / CBS 7301 / JCM 7358 / NBRC 10748 / NRRL Y-17804) TaxID=698492 RepID=A0A0E9NFR1_SAICN|nr:uncharacterized protein SAICODRAFT_26363 [Saitoella complicata NRRL Y-17804]ODQ51954.1 hypothetical protein SAICODRAFT_26363 [Saitoella complicata NRRL Y-17804]GAO48653.1 hypothetical protein G7K_2823-t1 [Saitoella complicata NRRL Y-17804]
MSSLAKATYIAALQSESYPFAIPMDAGAYARAAVSLLMDSCIASEDEEHMAWFQEELRQAALWFEMNDMINIEQSFCVGLKFLSTLAAYGHCNHTCNYELVLAIVALNIGHSTVSEWDQWPAWHWADLAQTELETYQAVRTWAIEKALNWNITLSVTEYAQWTDFELPYLLGLKEPHYVEEISRRYSVESEDTAFLFNMSSSTAISIPNIPKGRRRGQLLLRVVIPVEQSVVLPPPTGYVVDRELSPDVCRVSPMIQPPPGLEKFTPRSPIFSPWNVTSIEGMPMIQTTRATTFTGRLPPGLEHVVRCPPVFDTYQVEETQRVNRPFRLPPGLEHYGQEQVVHCAPMCNNTVELASCSQTEVIRPPPGFEDIVPCPPVFDAVDETMATVRSRSASQRALRPPPGSEDIIPCPPVFASEKQRRPVHTIRPPPGFENVLPHGQPPVFDNVVVDEKLDPAQTPLAHPRPQLIIPQFKITQMDFLTAFAAVLEASKPVATIRPPPGFEGKVPHPA